VDPSQRGSLEGHAFPIPICHDLLAAPSPMDRAGHLAESLGEARPASGSPRSSQPPRRACRRYVLTREKRGEKVGKTKRGKGTKIMVLVDGNGLPLAVDTASASPHEVTLIEPLLARRVVRRKPAHLIYDLAADSDPLRTRLRKRGIHLVCPHRGNRTKPSTQDGRRLRRYCRRWKVERSISWLQNFRRLVTRYEHHAHLFHGFSQLACLVVVLGRF
jgi:transposase